MPDGTSAAPQYRRAFNATELEHYDEVDLLALEQSLPILFRGDALDLGGDSVFFARQLNYIKARTYDKQYPAMKADVLVPDATDVPEWAETVSMFTYDQVGMAKIVANYADDLPRADVRGAEVIVRVRTLGDSYGYNVNELRASRATGVGLDSRKADAARRAIEMKIASIKMVGDLAYGLYGLFNHPNVPVAVLPHTGTWTGMTAAFLFDNMNYLSATYAAQNLGVHKANYLALAPAAYLAVSTTIYNVNTGMTVLGFWQSLNPGVTVESVLECKGADPATGKDVALLYEQNADNISHEMVMAFTQLPPEARNLEIVTNCLARSGGVHIWYPLALLTALTS
jgi:hypothetical protein